MEETTGIGIAERGVLYPRDWKNHRQRGCNYPADIVKDVVVAWLVGVHLRRSGSCPALRPHRQDSRGFRRFEASLAIVGRLGVLVADKIGRVKR